MSRPSRILILAHGDMWGLKNLHHILPVLQAKHRGTQIEIALSQKTPVEGGGYAEDTIPQFDETSHFKEGYLNALLRYVDTADEMQSRGKPQMPSFERQNKAIGNAPEALHRVACGRDGGEAVERIVERFKPDVVLDLDSFIRLSGKTVAEVPSYLIHPGPLPQVDGKYCTARQIVHERFQGDKSTRKISGSIVRLMPPPEEPVVLSNKHVTFEKGDSLFDARAKLYEAMMHNVCWMLPELLRSPNEYAKSRRYGNKPLPFASTPSTVAQTAVCEAPVPELTAEDMQRWLINGHRICTTESMLDVVRDILPPQVKLTELCYPGLLPKGITYDDAKRYDDTHHCWVERAKGAQILSARRDATTLAGWLGV